MTPSQHHHALAGFFTAFSHRRRLMLCDILFSYDAEGISFEHLQAASGLAASTLSFHLRQMDKGKILRRRQKGREVRISINLSRLRGLGLSLIRV